MNYVPTQTISTNYNQSRKVRQNKYPQHAFSSSARGSFGLCVLRSLAVARGTTCGSGDSSKVTLHTGKHLTISTVSLAQNFYYLVVGF